MQDLTETSAGTSFRIALQMSEAEVRILPYGGLPCSGTGATDAANNGVRGWSCRSECVEIHVSHYVHWSNTLTSSIRSLSDSPAVHVLGRITHLAASLDWDDQEVQDDPLHCDDCDCVGRHTYAPVVWRHLEQSPVRWRIAQELVQTCTKRCAYGAEFAGEFAR